MLHDHIVGCLSVGCLYDSKCGQPSSVFQPLAQLCGPVAKPPPACVAVCGTATRLRSLLRSSMLVTQPHLPSGGTERVLSHSRSLCAARLNDALHQHRPAAHPADPGVDPGHVLHPGAAGGPRRHRTRPLVDVRPRRRRRAQRRLHGAGASSEPPRALSRAPMRRLFVSPCGPCSAGSSRHELLLSAMRSCLCIRHTSGRLSTPCSGPRLLSQVGQAAVCVPQCRVLSAAPGPSCVQLADILGTMLPFSSARLPCGSPSRFYPCAGPQH